MIYEDMTNDNANENERNILTIYILMKKKKMYVIYCVYWYETYEGGYYSMKWRPCGKMTNYYDSSCSEESEERKVMIQWRRTYWYEWLTEENEEKYDEIVYVKMILENNMIIIIPIIYVLMKPEY